MFWVYVAIFFIVVEAINPVTLHWIFFAGAAILSFLVSLITDSIIIQALTFIIFSVVFLYSYFKYGYKRNKERIPTNLDRLVGYRFVAEQEIKPYEYGEAVFQNIDGTDWWLVSDRNIIEKGELCKVVRLEATKLVVEKIEKEV